MEYTLKNGDKVTIRQPRIDDAADIISVIKTADKETLFLAREPEEFIALEEQEKEMIANVLKNNDMSWFVAEYKGKIVHTTDSIGRRGVAQGIVCQTCPGGCKTDCLREGVIWEYTRLNSLDFDAMFADSETYSVGLEDAEY